MTIKTINPATEQLLREYPEHEERAVARKLEQAQTAFDQWKRMSFAERAEHMREMAQQLRRDRAPLAELATHEMGKPIDAAEGEIDKCAWVCEYYADHAEGFLTRQRIETDARDSYVRYDPLGTVLAIMPWNFPFWQLYRFAAPAVMAGNCFVLKHSSNVAGVALAIERLFAQCGFPEGLASTLLVSNERVADIISHPAIRAVTLTGSDRAGRAVAETAGRQIKKAVLELGGSDPFIVLADADPVEAAQRATEARTINSGQSCIAAKRFIVEEPVADAFERAMVDQMQRLKVGDPLDRSQEIGPLAREDLLEDLHDQVERSVRSGAQLKCGGKRLDRAGYFYPPTVLTEVAPGMAAFDEETFGPVAALCRARDRGHALQLANQSPYGLAAAIFTGDMGAAHEMAASLEAGCVFINGVVKSDPRLPFGGVKQSGYGRELSEVGIREFVNIKTVWVG